MGSRDGGECFGLDLCAIQFYLITLTTTMHSNFGIPKKDTLSAASEYTQDQLVQI